MIVTKSFKAFMDYYDFFSWPYRPSGSGNWLGKDEILKMEVSALDQDSYEIEMLHGTRADSLWTAV